MSTKKLRMSKAQFRRTAKSLESFNRMAHNPPTRKQYWFCAVQLTELNMTDQDYFGRHWKKITLSKSLMIDVIKHLVQCNSNNVPAHSVAYQAAREAA